MCPSTHPDQIHNHSILSRDRKCAPVEVYLPGPPFKEGFSCKKCGKLTASNCWHLQGLCFHFCAEAPNVCRQPSATMANGRDTRVCSFLTNTGLLQWPSLSRELPFGFSKTLSDLCCSLRLPLAPSCIPHVSLHRCEICTGLRMLSLPNPVPPHLYLLQALSLHSLDLLHF